MDRDKVEVDHVVYGHTQKFIGASMAFSIATVLLCVQGSIPVTKGVSQLGVVFLTLAIPACLFAFVVNTKLLRYDTVSKKSLGLVDKFLGMVIGLAGVGFICLVAGASSFLGIVFGAGTVVAFFITWYIVYRFEKLNSDKPSE